MKSKKIVLFVFLMMGVLSLILIYKFKQNNLSKNKPVKEEKLSIMIKESGATEYTKSSSKDIPKGDYTLNTEKSYCKNNGKIEGYDNITGTVSFAFIGTDKCFLYFDYKIPPLYTIIENRYNNDDQFVKLYNGADYGDTTNYVNNIYYFNGAVENNNVLFGGFCWKIVRTTDTGGVKIVYNGTLKDGSCNNTGTDSQIGKSSFNSSYKSPAYVGYMYNENKVYTTSSKTIVNSASFSGTIAYANAVIYDSNTETYSLDSSTATTGSNVDNYVGKYTICNKSSTTDTCTYAWYIVGYENFGARGNYIYYYVLSKGDVNGTDNGSNYVFGSSFTYANGSYTLIGTVTINSDTWSTNRSNLNTHHYTCLTSGNSCKSVYYVHTDNPGTLYYIKLTNGKSVEDALNEMLYADDVNTTDSTIKAYIDSWYEENIKDKYDDKLEDTVFCNDRSMGNESSNGWYPNGGSTSTDLYFKNSTDLDINYNLACENKNDRFTVATSNGNGVLIYPVGLLTAPEVRLAYNGTSKYGTYYLKTGSSFWLISPNFSYLESVYGNLVGSKGTMSYALNVSSCGVRPVISLKPNTIPISGDGTYTNPFVVQ